MKIKDTDICICGHSKVLHEIGDAWKGHCLFCFGVEYDLKRGHKFQLNNLDYIERLAKEKGLI